MSEDSDQRSEIIYSVPKGEGTLEKFGIIDETPVYNIKEGILSEINRKLKEERIFFLYGEKKGNRINIDRYGNYISQDVFGVAYRRKDENNETVDHIELEDINLMEKFKEEIGRYPLMIQFDDDDGMTMFLNENFGILTNNELRRAITGTITRSRKKVYVQIYSIKN